MVVVVAIQKSKSISGNFVDGPEVEKKRWDNVIHDIRGD